MENAIPHWLAVTPRKRTGVTTASSNSLRKGHCGIRDCGLESQVLISTTKMWPTAAWFLLFLFFYKAGWVKVRTVVGTPFILLSLDKTEELGSWPVCCGAQKTRPGQTLYILFKVIFSGLNRALLHRKTPNPGYMRPLRWTDPYC